MSSTLPVAGFAIIEAATLAEASDIVSGLSCDWRNQLVELLVRTVRVCQAGITWPVKGLGRKCE
jgi:hypothetical protein